MIVIIKEHSEGFGKVSLGRTDVNVDDKAEES